MRFLSVCSGIEAASVAWNPLGWKAAAFAEIEPFPCAVLAHHYPTVPNWGDMTKYKDWPDVSIDLLCGGTPCQSFSNAGLRAGLDDPRGQLMLTFGAIAARYRPRWLVWENVPGVLSSNGGRDFGALLGLLGFLGYGFAYRVLDAQYVRVDGHRRAVPQRRNRVFVVGCLGDWRSAAAVLLERESLRGDPAPRREAGARVAGAVARSLAIRGRDGTPQAELGDDVANALVTPSGGRGGIGVGAVLTAFGGNNTSGPRDVASALSAHGGTGRHDFETETFIAHTLRADGFDASEDGPGRGTPLVPVYAPGCAGTMVARSSRGGGQTNSPGHNADEELVAYSIMPQNSGKDYKAREVDVAQPLMAGGPTTGNQGGDFIQHAMRVRRLMPIECERLQGFPDGYTAVPFRGKPAADGPRYKALGNSWAVNCPRWIGRRINLVETIHAQREMEAA
jgi:DNA (cytosine-5)-methyltransferase 1